MGLRRLKEGGHEWSKVVFGRFKLCTVAPTNARDRSDGPVFPIFVAEGHLDRLFTVGARTFCVVEGYVHNMEPDFRPLDS